jgi:SH3-like domain-containing protein
MKFRLIIGMIAVCCVATADTNEVAKVKVLGNNVSLRAKPDINSELIDRAMKGEEMVFLDKTNGWVAVQAPQTMNLWVSAQYIQNGVVQPEKLNVRKGPNLNHVVLAVVKQGDVLALRGEFNGWLKIAPPEGSQVWISEQFTEIIEPPKPEPEPQPEPESEPEPVVEKVPEPKEELPPLMLVLDKNKKQGIYDEIPGILRRANPGLYKLVLITDGFEEPICLVRGKEEQMEHYLNRSMLIKGKKYWAQDVEIPVIQPIKIHLDPILKD